MHIKTIQGEINAYIDRKLIEFRKSITNAKTVINHYDNIEKLKFYTCTQTEYDAITTPDDSTIYVIVED